jgi:hypothetical protein
VAGRMFMVCEGEWQGVGVNGAFGSKLYEIRTIAAGASRTACDTLGGSNGVIWPSLRHSDVELTEIQVEPGGSQTGNKFALHVLSPERPLAPDTARA